MELYFAGIYYCVDGNAYKVHSSYSSFTPTLKIMLLLYTLLGKIFFFYYFNILKLYTELECITLTDEQDTQSIKPSFTRTGGKSRLQCITIKIIAENCGC